MNSTMKWGAKTVGLLLAIMSVFATSVALAQALPDRIKMGQ